MKLFVILPAYNEAESLPPIFEGLEKQQKSIFKTLIPIVVDDGSYDQTASVATKAGCSLPTRVVRHKQNSGLGAALRTGIETALSMSDDDDILVLLDADNTHDPVHMTTMVAQLNAGYDVVIASRYAPGGREVGLSLLRSLGSRAVSFAISVIFPVQGARDYTCGFRAYRASALKRALAAYGDALITESSFVCMAELLVKLSSVGARVSEIPLILRYDLKGGPSKMNIPKTLWRYFRFAMSQRNVISITKARYQLSRKNRGILERKA